MKIYPRVLELKLIGVEKQLHAEMIDIYDGKLSKVERRKSELCTVLFVTILLLIKNFYIPKAFFVLYFSSF